MRVGLTDSAGLTHAMGILPVLARFVSRWIYELVVENDTSDEQKAPLYCPHHPYNADKHKRQATPMQTLTSREVQKNFGPVADMVAAGQCIRVTKYGRPAFLIIPESEDSDEILRRLAGRRLTVMLKGGVAKPAAKALSSDDVRQLIDDCFA